MPVDSGRTGRDNQANRRGQTAPEFLQSYTTRPGENFSGYVPSNIPLNEFDDYDSLTESWDPGGHPDPSSTEEMYGRHLEFLANQNRNGPDTQPISNPDAPSLTQSSSKNTGFKNFISSGKAYAQNPLRTKQNLISETLARYEQETPYFNRDQFVNTASDVFNEAKAADFNDAYAQGGWRRASTEDSNLAAQQFMEEKETFLNSLIKQNAFGRVLESSNDFISKGLRNVGSALENKIRYPDFVSNALALRNPVVESGSVVPEGSFINPQAVKFLKEFKPERSALSTNYESPFGTSVNVAGGKNSEYNLAFTGPFGYKQSNVIKKEIKRNLEKADTLERSGFTEEATSLRDSAVNKQELLNEPLRSPALRYTLGAALENVPVGSTVTAEPIGASAGARARIYSALTNNALVTDPGVVPNHAAYPTEEEFRAAREGSQSPANYSYGELLRRNVDTRDRIKSEKLSPTTWLNVRGEEREFNPSALKDEMIRATYNLPNEVDVSNLRSNPLSELIKTNRIDFTKPVITTESPVYKLRQGIKGAASISAADLIPSREAVQDFYAGKPLQGFGRMAGDVASGIPAALATGAVVSAAPALAPLAPGIGAGFATIRAANALDEASRKQTGEGLISKFRQTIGTEPRTGYANPDFRTTSQAVTPQITALTPQQRRTMEQRQNRNELQKRLDLFKERFNPSRGEFGFSELMFGR